MEKSVSFYEKSFYNSDTGMDFLYSLHIKDSSVFSKFRIGFSDGSILSALPRKGNIIDELHKLGILQKRKEFFNNCLTFPIFDIDLNVINIAGIDLKTMKEKYLFDDGDKSFNLPTVNTYSDIYQTRNIIDLLTLETSGIYNAVAGNDDLPSKGINVTILNEDLNKMLIQHGTDVIQAHLAKSSRKNNMSKKEFIDGVEFTDTGFKFQSGLINYEVIGLVKKPRNMKATLRVEKAGKLHVDTIDFYISKQRRQFTREICCTFEDLPAAIDAEHAVGG